ncbi:MAG: low molecular weight phosphatase family protein [Dehalococcoidia bacterium]
MNVLFVCVANVARSQIAEAFFNRLSRHQATSAGLQVGDKQGQTLHARSQEPTASTATGYLLRIMREEEGIDLTGNLRNQLTPELVEQADRVFVIAPEGPYPDYLQGSKVTFWDIQDLYGEPYETVQRLKNQIKERVQQLAEEIG